MAEAVQMNGIAATLKLRCRPVPNALFQKSLQKIKSKCQSP